MVGERYRAHMMYCMNNCRANLYSQGARIYDLKYEIYTMSKSIQILRSSLTFHKRVSVLHRKCPSSGCIVVVLLFSCVYTHQSVQFDFNFVFVNGFHRIDLRIVELFHIFLARSIRPTFHSRKKNWHCNIHSMLQYQSVRKIRLGSFVGFRWVFYFCNGKLPSCECICSECELLVGAKDGGNKSSSSISGHCANKRILCSSWVNSTRFHTKQQLYCAAIAAW